MVHRNRKRWHVDDDLPWPPYVDDDGNRGRGAKSVVSYALAGGATSDVICVSTRGRGTYCFDTASRVWSKAGDWALPFSGKVERDRELGI
ncbi:hypothetical protein HU200_054487 [Digitaria exilis]|uniref:Uncharacterized protein n=1 Tax=Digitaria exilis TaxID=1010633 RepID=A0A835E7N2_9POAL|nr:hypothetical protein HU200_054487 [Digitaria exilis]